MKGILDRVAAEWHSDFCPKTTAEYLALRVAQNLGEPAAARHYVLLIGQHGEEKVLAAYRQTLARGVSAGAQASHFHATLPQIKDDGRMSDQILLAIKVERRSIAAAVFEGTHLDYTQVRQLPSNREKVNTSVIGFLNLMFSHFKIDAAALEQISA